MKGLCSAFSEVEIRSRYWGRKDLLDNQQLQFSSIQIDFPNRFFKFHFLHVLRLFRTKQFETGGIQTHYLLSFFSWGASSSAVLQPLSDQQVKMRTMSISKTFLKVTFFLRSHAGMRLQDLGEQHLLPVGVVVSAGGAVLRHHLQVQHGYLPGQHLPSAK